MFVLLLLTYFTQHLLGFKWKSALALACLSWCLSAAPQRGCRELWAFPTRPCLSPASLCLPQGDEGGERVGVGGDVIRAEPGKGQAVAVELERALLVLNTASKD